jgi:hypothetical protein
MNIISKYFDLWSWLVVATTFALFVLALFIKGLTHEMLLETAVFLVSVKLILMTYKNSVAADSQKRKLDEIYTALVGLKPQDRDVRQ